MAPTGVSLDLYDAVREAEKREKAARQKQSDMLVDMALEAGYLRHLLRRVVLIVAGTRHEMVFGLGERDLETLREAATAAGLDEKGAT